MNDWMDRLALTYTESPLLFWVLGSILIYAVAVNGLYLIQSRNARSSPHGRWLVALARALYFLGIPYLALGGWPRPRFSGLLSLADMGLVGLGGRWSPTRWLSATGTALGFGLVALVLLLVAWGSASRDAGYAPAGQGATGRLGFQARPWWLNAIDVLYLEVHWAFYRGACIVVLGDLYTGVFAGLGLVYLEWALNPFWRRGWLSNAVAAAQWLRAALALVVALIFLFTRNLWLCLGVHLLLDLIIRHLGRRRATAQANHCAAQSDR